VLHHYGDQIKENEVDGALARMGEMRNAPKSLIVKPDGKRPLTRPRHRSRMMLEWILGK
jgi:hypothetical protein